MNMNMNKMHKPGKIVVLFFYLEHCKTEKMRFFNLGHLFDLLVILLVGHPPGELVPCLMHLLVRHHLNDIHHLCSNFYLHHCQHNHQLRPSMSATMLATLSSSMLATMSATLPSSMSATTT